jgi:hypothetical protein
MNVQLWLGMDAAEHKNSCQECGSETDQRRDYCYGLECVMPCCEECDWEGEPI